VAVFRCQYPNFGEIVLVSGPAEADGEFTEKSRVEKFAELFASQAEILYRIYGQLSIPNMINNDKSFQLDVLTSSVIA